MAGVDEVGRGPLAGPVMAGAVILPTDWLKRRRRRLTRKKNADPRDLLNDSKKLTAGQREAVYEVIIETALAWSVGVCSAAYIDEEGDRPRHPPRHVRGGARARPSARRAARRRGRVDRAGACGEVDHPRRRLVRLDRGGLHRGQGHAGPPDGGDARALPRLRLRPQQGLRHGGAPAQPPRAGPVRHPPALLRADSLPNLLQPKLV